MRLPKLNLKHFLIGVSVALVGIGILGLITGAIVQSTHPDKKVRDGKVITHRFVPAHEETYYVQQYTGQTCINTGYGTNQTRICTSNYITVPQTDHIPDAWFITVQGCKRLRAESAVEYCEKPSTRTVHVDETQFHELKIGAEWHEAP